ncbi:MAG: DNA-directed RNA polymerase subunit beta', partial [Rickettsiales bacterium]|nr:DNA-directed RNA polymerase subunit beta' [Rickettsiales bacterium]
HVPISIESQIEARVLMMSTNNILSPANGKPIIVPSQDIILGLYYMSLHIDGVHGEGKLFSCYSEVEHALNEKSVSIHADVKYRSNGVTYNTTPGRILISEVLPDGDKLSFDVVNKVMTKKEVSNLIDQIYRTYGQKATVIFADQLMYLGFKNATISAISFGKDDMVIPDTKYSHINSTKDEIRQYEQQYSDGLITVGEKYNKVIDAWSLCSEKVSEDMMRQMSSIKEEKTQTEFPSESINSVYMMAHSGARGSATQIKQLAGMRGLMAKPSGEIIETPIIANFKEGLSVFEYFNSAHGARKGLADTALKTANSGYLTRRLVDVAQDCIITEEDCKTKQFITLRPEIEGANITVPLSEKVLGRTTVEDIVDFRSNEVIVKKGHIINEDQAAIIDTVGFDSINVRSSLTCEAKRGICSKCYGRDLSTGGNVNIGEAVGVIAAQSIGEPGTQLTMRTFHIGGAAQKGAEQSSIESPLVGTVVFDNISFVKNSKGNLIVLNRNSNLIIKDEAGIQKAKYKVPYGAKLKVQDGTKVSIGDRLAEWDPYNIPIISEVSGKIIYRDMIESVSYKEEHDFTTGITNRVLIDWKSNNQGASNLIPRIVIQNDKGDVQKLSSGMDARYFLFLNSILNVTDGQEIHAGDVIARMPKASSKIADITGGLPRVAELFEARKPKDYSIISEISGTVIFGKDYKSRRRIIIKPDNADDKEVECLIPKGKHITVNEGDHVEKGDQLMDGKLVPHDILRVLGVEALAHYMVFEIQKVYRLQGVKIDDKHIEIIVLQMLKKVEVVNSGETTLVNGEILDKEEFDHINDKAKKDGYERAEARPVLQGITKAALQTNSFVSAASFQETTKVLTEAAVLGSKDMLYGLKENVIVGRLIPAGTGYFTNLVKKKAHSIDAKQKAAVSNTEDSDSSKESA